MATTNKKINNKVDPSIRTTQSTFIDMSSVASSTTVNTKVDPQFGSGSKKPLVTPPIANTATVTIPTDPVVSNVSMTRLINTIVQNYLSTYSGSVGSSYRANIADVANSVAYVNVTGKPSFATIATSGSYNDLLNLPSLASYATQSYVTTAINNLVDGAPAALDTLKELANSLANNSSYASTITSALAGKVDTSALSSYATTTYVDNKATWANISGKPALFSGSYADLTNKPSLFSGSYVDLTNKPSLFNGDYNNLSNKPSLYSGSYADLTSKPTLGNISSIDKDGNASNILYGNGVFAAAPTGGASTGNWEFRNDTIYNYAGGQINNSDTAHGATAGLTLPDNGRTDPGAVTTLFNNYGNVVLRSGEFVTTDHTIGSNGSQFYTDVDIGNGFGVIDGWRQRNQQQIEINIFTAQAPIWSVLIGASLGATVIVTYSTLSGNQTFTSVLSQQFTGQGQNDPGHDHGQRYSGRIDGTLPAGQTGIVSINFPTSTVTNKNWVFDKDGNLTVPGGGVINNDGDTNVVNIVGLNYASMQSHNNYIWVEETYAAIEVDGYQWTFHDDAVLTIANGANISQTTDNGGQKTFNITPPDTSDFEVVTVAGNIRLQTVNSYGVTSTWTFDKDGNLALPQGTILSETANSTAITPPNALAGQSLVVRLTGAQGISSDHPGGFADGDTITITIIPDYNLTPVTGTVDYTFTDCTQQQLGRALTGTLTFTIEPSKLITWTIPVSSTMTTFTITLSNAVGFSIGGLISPLTLTRSGSSEDHHVHLIAGDPSITDMYLGDDDQYVKIEKNGGNVVVGTSTNNNQWTFGTDGTTTVPTGNITSDTSLQLTTTFENYRTVEYQTAGVWDVYVEDVATGPNDAWSWIDVTFKDNLINKPQVYIENQKASDGIAHRWTFDENGNLTLPSDTSKINYANGTSILSGFITSSTPTLDNASAGDMDVMIYDGNLKHTSKVTIDASAGHLKTAGNLSVSGNTIIQGNLSVTGGIRKSARVLTTTTTLTTSDASGFIEFAGSGTYTVTLPDPTQAANSGIGYRFWQNTSQNITLSTPAGNFYGPSGSSASTKVLAQATTQYWDVWSDGYNWAVFGIKIA